MLQQIRGLRLDLDEFDYKNNQYCVIFNPAGNICACLRVVIPPNPFMLLNNKGYEGIADDIDLSAPGVELSRLGFEEAHYFKRIGGKDEDWNCVASLLYRAVYKKTRELGFDRIYFVTMLGIVEHARKWGLPFISMKTKKLGESRKNDSIDLCYMDWREFEQSNQSTAILRWYMCE